MSGFRVSYLEAWVSLTGSRYVGEGEKSEVLGLRGLCSIQAAMTAAS